MTSFFLHGCYYDVEEELYPSTGSSCDTLNVTYAADIVPILQQSCYTCHSIGANLGGVTVEGYDEIIVLVEDGRLAGAVNHLSGFSPMPKDASQLDDCSLALINNWINDGALNN